MGGHGYSSLSVFCVFVTRGAWAATGIVVCWFVCLLPEARVGGHGYSSLSVCWLFEIFNLLTWLA